MLKGMQILVAEDEYLISVVIEDYLSELGCEAVYTASRLPIALDRARTLPLDMALLDVNLAGQMSYPAAEILRSRSVPFMFVTGYGTAGLPGSLRTVPVLGKPFEKEQFAMAIRSLLGRPPGQ